MNIGSYFGKFFFIRLIFQRFLAFIYIIAFLSALNQFPALLGETGLEPVPEFLKRISFRYAPSIFHFAYSDRLFMIIALLGIVLSILALLGISERGPLWISMSAWFLLWIFYLSIVNVGQTFYSFGWEMMLLEAGFFAVFLGPTKMEPSMIPIMILRWMLFRVELGSGLIKLRYDSCWRDLTCLFFHFETQPLPNPLSWYFHYLPKWVNQTGVLFSHFVQIIVPFGLFGPKRIASIAGCLIIIHQLLLIVSGNFSWFNWLTVVLAITAFNDSIFAPLKVSLPLTVGARPTFFNGILYALAALTILLSVQPTLNLFSKDQMMNYSYNRLHIVNTYGAFGNVTKIRHEIVIEGTDEAVLTPYTKWKPYEFHAKPGNIFRRPPQIAPYHLRLDWLMWFLPFSVRVTNDGIDTPKYEKWFLTFIRKLLVNDKKTLGLLKFNPFPDNPPRFIRARFYLYKYTNNQERKETGAWWNRTLIGEYLRPVSLSDFKQL